MLKQHGNISNSRRFVVRAVACLLALVLLSVTLAVSRNAQAAESEPKKSFADPYGVFDSKGLLTRSGRDATGKSGMVVTAKAEASEVGMKILEQGGNAIDAAVAAGFALSVLEPMSSGLGGGGFITLYLAKSNETLFIDFREVAPGNASPDMWAVDKDGKVVNDEKMTGGKAVGVPGEVAGLTHVLEKYGTMKLTDVMRPAIDYAEKGYTVTPTLAGDIKDSYDKITQFPEMAKIFLKKDFPYEAGEIFANPDLARTLGAIAKNGKDAFYKGEIAERIVQSVQDAGGSLTLDDLAKYEVTVSKPVKGTYRGYEIVSSPPPSSGGTHVIQILNVLENYDIASMKINSPEYLHLFSEAFKLAYADRAKYMGDTRFVKVPLTGLSSKKYAARLKEKIDPKRAQKHTFDDPWSFEHQDTTHFSVVDKEGNMVAVTKTINGLFGSKVVGYGTGVLLNNEMGDFDTGAGKSNSVEPGKKPLSSMSPTLVLKEGKPIFVLGTPGGARIISTVVQIVSRLIDHELDIQDAINLPRIADTGFGKMACEARIEPQVVQELEKMGHEISVDDPWSRMFGSVHAVEIRPDGTIRGGADPRKDGKAFGY